ncbi:glutaredoxin [Arthrobacter sp. ERGS1:01]|uniref:glutaredoxin family protein n=1 Tax=Arthrobacter sp. ERGS1:01 TaxID=1704044 RepID=UPI0006B4A6D4|nr:glutaredoxin family protein [Arthrobacter sp. ERGS1:01]ALE04887.1 glutaredoxin [Arthrobacter sp. ERGS1:01]
MAVTIYSKPAGGFGYTKTRELFNAAGIENVLVDITTNAAALEYVSEKRGYSQAPVVVYEREGTVNHWSGLNPPEIKKIITIEQAA